jgi:hypothetical protein
MHEVPEPLPHERHGVHAEDLDPAVGQPQHRVEDRGEDVRVGVVEVPLVAEERRPHPRAAAAVRVPTQVNEPGARSGKTSLIVASYASGMFRSGKAK